MRSAAEPSNAALDGVRTCWIKSTIVWRRRPKKKKRSTIFATEPICARGRSSPPPTSASPISMTICPIPGHSASISIGELYSSVRDQRADFGMAEVVLDRGLRRNSSSEAGSGRGHHRSGALRRRSRQGQKRFPELPYVTLRLAYMACEYFNADLGLAIVRAEHQAFYRRVFLHETIAEPRLFPGLAQAGRTDGGEFPDDARKGFRALSDDALDRLRAADVVRARRRASISPADVCSPPSEGTSIVPQSCRVGRCGSWPLAEPSIGCGFGRGGLAAAPTFVRRGYPIAAEIRRFRRRRQGLPSPSRHIYRPLTIPVALLDLPAFDRSGNLSSRLTERSLNHRPVDRRQS